MSASNPPSLADSAVYTLSQVAAMSELIDLDDENRHHIRTLKRVAESILNNAFREATEIAHAAKQLREDTQASKQEKS